MEKIQERHDISNEYSMDGYYIILADGRYEVSIAGYTVKVAPEELNSLLSMLDSLIKDATDWYGEYEGID